MQIGQNSNENGSIANCQSSARKKKALSLPHIVGLDYDDEADVLYIYFKINPEIAESDMID
ncbi:MAG: hypothetical protein ACE5R6_17500 [Candidatus Heimdallarchaeota archaeon]